MKPTESESYVVEFWAKPFKDIGDKEVPQTTVCVSMDACVALESKFHEVGWPARAILLRESVARNYLTSGG
jgi:hypothetical protein